MPQLTGGYERISLGGGYEIIAPGLRGRVERLTAGVAGVRAIESSSPLLESGLARTEMSSVATIEITATGTPAPAAPPIAVLRDSHGADALLLEVPDLGPLARHVVLCIDEAGALTWHFPVEGGQDPSPGVRGAGKKRFLMRRHVLPAPSPETARDRALFGSVGRKLLKVIVYPVTDLLIGASAAAIADHWEHANRAYRLRDFTSGTYRRPLDVPSDHERVTLTPAAVAKLARGRALLFIHGTFSTAHAAFHDIPPDFMSELDQRYEGRLFAFNHFSLAHDPEQNVRKLVGMLRDLSQGYSLDVDIVCHSRGGLVARTLAEGVALGIDVGGLRVHRVVFVGVPNSGTLLADPDHMVEMIDRFTTALNLIPPGSPADLLEGLLIGIKIIGHGALNGLVGLRSMHPSGPFLSKLNHGGDKKAEYFAIAADFKPADPGLRSIVSRSADAFVDNIFEEAGNDLVVPEKGVYDANGCGSFPIGMDRCLRLPASAGVMHTTMFGHAGVVGQLDKWLRTQ